MPSLIEKFVVLLLFCVVHSSCRESITNVSPEQVKDIGESAELSCTVDKPEEYSVIWSKKSRDRPADPVILSFNNQLTLKDKRINLTTDGNTFTLHITNIEFSDAGSYECQAIATTRDKSTALVELLVKHAPKVDSIEITPNPLAVNGTVQLKCLASGYPRPSIIWRRENDAILPAGGTSFAGNILTLNEVKQEDRGIYYCIADNGVGTDRRSANFDVEFPPQISVPRPKVAQALDYDIELECRVQGYPAPSVTWYRDDQELHNSGGYTITNTAEINQVTSSVLRIDSIDLDQYGDYICKANNKLGTAQRRLNVFEQPIPNAYFANLQRSSTNSVHQNSAVLLAVVVAFIISDAFGY